MSMIQRAEFDSVFGTTVTTHSDSTVTQSADLRAGIVARTGDLVLKVGKDLVVTGADLKAAGALTGRVGGNIKVEALSLENSRTRVDTVSNERSYTLNNGETETTGLTASGRTVSTRIDSEIRHQASVLEAGGKLDLESAGSTLIVGAQVKSGADTRIVAGGHLALGAAVDSTHLEQRVTTQLEGAAILPGLPTAGGERLELKHSDTAIGGQMDAGGATTLQAGGSLILSGQRISSGGDTRLAGSSVALDGISLENRSEARNAGSTVVALDARSLHRGSAIQSGGSLDVTATGVPEDASSTAGSIRGRGAQLDAKRALTLAAAGDITLEAGRNTEDYVSRNHSGTAIVERSRDESARNLLNGEAISVAGRNITLEAASLNSPGKVSIVARDALSLAAATDTTSDHTLSVTKTGSWLSKKTTTVEHSEQSLRAATTRIDAQDILLQSGADLDLYGARLNAGGEVRLAAGGELHAYAVQDVHSVMDRKKVVRAPGIGALLLGEDPTFRRRKTETRDSSTTDEAQVTQLQSVGELTAQSGGDTLLQGTSITAARTTIAVGVGDKAEADATLILEGAKNRLDTSHTVSKKSFVWQNQSGQGEGTETLQVVNIQGPVTIQAQKIVAQLPEGDFKTQLAKQAAQPGQAWMLQLADRPGVDWKAVALAHDKWDYQQEGLTAEAALIITIVVSILTYGAASGAGAALGSAVQATTASAAAGAAAGAATTAALTTLAAQATVSLINNKGNLGQTLSDLGSSDSVKVVVASMLTAGLTAGVAQAFQLPNPAISTAFADRVTTYATQAAVRAGVQSAVFGTPLEDTVKVALVTALTQSLTAEIGDWGRENNVENGALAKVLAHATVQCTAALVVGGDCGAAAIGGATAELLSPLADQAGRWGAVVTATGSLLAARLLGADGLTAVGAGMTVDGFNRQLHADQEKILASLASNDPGKQAQLKQVLCLEQNCAFDKNGLVSDEARELQRAGYDLRSRDPERYEQLLGVIHEAKLLDGSFEYGDMARIGDAASAAWVMGAANRAGTLILPDSPINNAPEAQGDLGEVAKGAGKWVISQVKEAPAYPPSNEDQTRGAQAMAGGALVGSVLGSAGGRVPGSSAAAGEVGAVSKVVEGGGEAAEALVVADRGGAKGGVQFSEVSGGAKLYPDGSLRTPDGKFASVAGQPAPGTTAASNYADFLSQNGVNVVGKEMVVEGPIGPRRYDIVVRDGAGNLQGIEIKTGTAGKTPYQDFTDMFVNQFGVQGTGRIAGESVKSSITIFLP